MKPLERMVNPAMATANRANSLRSTALVTKQAKSSLRRNSLSHHPGRALWLPPRPWRVARSPFVQLKAEGLAMSKCPFTAALPRGYALNAKTNPRSYLESIRVPKNEPKTNPNKPETNPRLIRGDFGKSLIISMRRSAEKKPAISRQLSAVAFVRELAES